MYTPDAAQSNVVALNDRRTIEAVESLLKRGDVPPIPSQSHGGEKHEQTLQQYVASGTFRTALAKWQRANGLVPDGIIGPVTTAAVLGEKIDPPFVHGGSIVYSGASVQSGMDTQIEIHTGLATKPVLKSVAQYALDFARYPASWRRRLSSVRPNLIVLHWDACPTARTCFNVLVQRGLSVHFTVDWDGTIRQHLDCELAAFHAAPENWRSIGIEINNPYHSSKASHVVAQGREPYTEPPQIGGMTHLGFTAAQTTSVVGLCDVLCKVLGIPRQIPGKGKTACLGKGVVMQTSIKDEFAGVCGHYHISAAKHDPGAQLWPAFFDAGYKATMQGIRGVSHAV